MTFVFQSKSEAQTDHLGAVLADALPPGTTVALIGTLGAGKTRLVQAVARALGVPPETATSPTFVLVNEYRGGRIPLFHFDAYRLKDEDEFLELGPEEYFESNGITFIEWADRVADCLPEDHVRIEAESLGETQRGFTITATSPTLDAALQSAAGVLALK
jgi:tRNA threonylcarbamoyladenosine biosynthesis protein TsaE